MENERLILEQMIESNVNYEDIVKQSQVLDKLIVDYCREGRCN